VHFTLLPLLLPLLLLLLLQDPVSLLQENPQILLNLGESNVEDSAEVGACLFMFRSTSMVMYACVIMWGPWLLCTHRLCVTLGRATWRFQQRWALGHPHPMRCKCCSVLPLAALHSLTLCAGLGVLALHVLVHANLCLVALHLCCMQETLVRVLRITMQSLRYRRVMYANSSRR
jgi:hypothetical protein